MRIGIDIDDTIANSWEYFMPIFSHEFNIKLDENSRPYYQGIKDQIPFAEFERVMKKYENTMINITLKENVSKILHKLKQDGHQIIFITARGKTYNNPYQITKEYLDNNNIPYDKIILDSWDKSIACREENIDLFIDDSPKHCKEVSNIGIEVIMMDAKYNQNNNQFTRKVNWDEIYKYIQSR